MAGPDLIAALEASPQGLSLVEFEAATGHLAAAVEAAVGAALSVGQLERWPFWPERMRATMSAPSIYLRAVAELRSAALPLQSRVHQHVGTPVTLHLLLGRAHAVIERYPSEQSETAMAERTRYARPRSLAAGATAMALHAHLPPQAQTTGDADELAEIRRLGFCLAEAASVPEGWVMSSAILAADGFSVAALCAYGSAADRTMEQARMSGPVLAEAARTLSAHAATAPIRDRLRRTIGA